MQRRIESAIEECLYLVPEPGISADLTGTREFGAAVLGALEKSEPGH